MLKPASAGIWEPFPRDTQRRRMKKPFNISSITDQGTTCLSRRSINAAQKQTLGSQGHYGLHPPARRTIYQKRGYDRPLPCLKESLSERHWIRHADAHVFHQSRRSGIEC